ncbi:YdeI/OmpD-associated family protein [Arthrospiribacter ruber]|nr:YdeI/OmpD-associated family protein [Arthrospiribacter ruber]
MPNPKVEAYLDQGCGRCEYFQTPKCKVHLWTEELMALREIALMSGLDEEIKWGVPCYTFEGNNVMLIGAFKGYCAMSFLKGVLLKDPHNILQKPGENSRVGRVAKFENLKAIQSSRQSLLELINDAIEVEKRGEKVVLDNSLEEIPEELQEKLEQDPFLKEAFDSLTPGRKRSFYIHISGAKQAATRRSRAEKCVPKILAGKGFNEY